VGRWGGMGEWSKGFFTLIDSSPSSSKFPSRHLLNRNLPPNPPQPPSPTKLIQQKLQISNPQIPKTLIPYTYTYELKKRHKKYIEE